MVMLLSGSGSVSKELGSVPYDIASDYDSDPDTDSVPDYQSKSRDKVC